MLNDFTCDLNCPVPGRVVCCVGCAESHKADLTDKNKRFWTKTKGFWGRKGCKLKRCDMPEICRVYDCHNHKFGEFREWNGTEWTSTYLEYRQTDRDVNVYKC